MTKVIYRVSDGFNRFLILGNIKLAYLFGPLTVYGTLERSLTAVSEYVDYESSRYPLKYSIKTFAMGITYTLYTTKK